MQQPTSNYYHAVYGAYLQFASTAESFLTKAIYIERPKFSANGFVDQDNFAMVLFGSHFSKKKNQGLYGYLGLGQTNGTIENNTEQTYSSNKRSFVMKGAALSMSYRIPIATFNISLNHTQFVGYGNKLELESRVAWPYQITQIEMGFKF